MEAGGRFSVSEHRLVPVAEGDAVQGSADDLKKPEEGSPRQQLIDVLQQYWGHDSFRPLQETAMTSALSGEDSLVVLPTGGGKSLCFQAPAMCLEGMAVVVSPLISLMKDQVDGLQQVGIPAACINHSLTLEERRLVAADPLFQHAELVPAFLGFLF